MTKKIICLHGYSMSSSWMQSWLKPIEEQLGDGVKLIYPQGPIECTEEQIRAVWKRIGMDVPTLRLGKGKNWCWYRATDDRPPTYRGIEETLQLLAKLFEKEGPIDGVIGWSQGSFLAMLMMGEMLNEAVPRFHFNWAVLGAGGVPADPRYQHYFQKTFNLPTLHVVGTKESDLMKQRCQALFDQFENAERLEPPVNHVMPIKYPEYMEKIGAWINSRI